MKILKALCLSAALLFTGCGPNGPLAQINWPDKVECLPPVGNVLGAAASILLSGFDGDKVESGLKELGEKHGFDTVICAVESLRRDWTAPGAAMSVERLKGIQAAEAFLVKVGTKISFK